MMKILRFYAIFTILLFYQGSLSLLNAQSSLKDTIKINEVIVTGTKVAVSRNNVPLSNAYVASDVERVEVIHDPASTLYGSNAMGGI